VEPRTLVDNAWATHKEEGDQDVGCVENRLPFPFARREVSPSSSVERGVTESNFNGRATPPTPPRAQFWGASETRLVVRMVASELRGKLAASESNCK